MPTYVFYYVHILLLLKLVRNSLDAKLKQEKHTRPAVVRTEFYYLQMLSRKIVDHWTLLPIYSLWMMEKITSTKIRNEKLYYENYVIVQGNLQSVVQRYEKVYANHLISIIKFLSNQSMQFS